MSISFENQLPNTNLGQEALMNQFMEDLMRFPGCYLRCPMPIHKGETTQEWDQLKLKICDETSNMLTMMGIEHRMDPTNFSIMVGLPP